MQLLLADQPAVGLRDRSRELAAGLGPQDALRVQPPKISMPYHAGRVADALRPVANPSADQTLDGEQRHMSVVSEPGWLSGAVTPARPNRRRISAQLMNSTGPPSASP